jgi:hypothetical protein
MNARFILTTVAGTLFLLILGWIIYGILLEGYMMANTYYPEILKNPPDWRTLIISQLCWAALLTLIFQKWANVTSFTGGIKVGFRLSIPLALGATSSIHCMFHMFSRHWLMADTVALVVIITLTGGVIGTILGIGKK